MFTATAPAPEDSTPWPGTSKTHPPPTTNNRIRGDEHHEAREATVDGSEIPFPTTWDVRKP